MEMSVICLDEPAFYALIEQVVERLNEKNGPAKDKWVAEPEAMRLLNVKSKRLYKKLRDEGKIRFSQPQKKIILYDRDSIEHYLGQHARETF